MDINFEHITANEYQSGIEDRINESSIALNSIYDLVLLVRNSKFFGMSRCESGVRIPVEVVDQDENDQILEVSFLDGDLNKTNLLSTWRISDGLWSPQECRFSFNHHGKPHDPVQGYVKEYSDGVGDLFNVAESLSQRELVFA